jgi:hypothetical protein
VSVVISEPVAEKCLQRVTPIIARAIARVTHRTMTGQKFDFEEL